MNNASANFYSLTQQVIVNKFLHIRLLLSYGQTFTEDNILNNSNIIGKRQVYTKLILFKGL